MTRNGFVLAAIVAAAVTFGSLATLAAFQPLGVGSVVIGLALQDGR